MFIRANEELIWQYVKRQRLDLLTYLTTLNHEQWNTNSLCAGWRVRNVLAHLILEYHYTPANSCKEFVRSGLRINTFLRRTAVQLGTASDSELLERFEAMVGERHKPSSVSVLNVLADLLVHEQDIRVPLGHHKDMPLDSLKLIFSHWQPHSYNVGEKITGVAARVKGLEFVITDLNMKKGSGLPVIGPAEATLLAVTGRKLALANLNGEGVAMLERRLGKAA